ncbi:MAG: hypothetical protein M3N93_03380, partial [Acidobacteriota bacterium]|nr:hypothetical protein [Acidobacteriota bacterium]
MRHEGPSRDWTKTHNDLSILIRENKVAGLVQLAIIWAIQRRTWGDDSRREWALLSQAALTKECPKGTDRKYVATSIADLIKRGIIGCEDGKGCTSAKRYKVTYENWKTAPSYEPAKLIISEEAEEDKVEVETAGQEKKPPVFRGRLTLRPGKPAKVPLRLQLERIEYECTGSE